MRQKNRYRKSRQRKVASKRFPRKARKRAKRSGLTIKRRRISNARLERGLLVLQDTGDIHTAARAIRVPAETFEKATKRKGLIRKRNGRWKVVAGLPRRVAIFTGGKQLAITVRSRTASLIGKYNSAVGQFLRTNNPDVLAEFAGRAVKDVHGKTYPFETNPNLLYRLSSAGGEPFEDIYRIVLH